MVKLSLVVLGAAYPNIKINRIASKKLKKLMETKQKDRHCNVFNLKLWLKQWEISVRE